MMRLLTLLAAMLPCACWGAPVVLTWTNPTQWDNGTALAAANIVSYRIQWTGACPGFGFVAPENDIVTPGNASTHTLEVTPGTRCFRVAVTARDPDCTVTATETCLRESPWSNIATKVVVEPPRVPEAPAGLTVQESSPTAYVIVKSLDRIALVPVGTVEPGTECDTTQPVLDKFVVPKAAVTFVSTVMDEVVLASCS